MADIYAGCLMTIAATWSDDSNGGCFSRARNGHRGYQLGGSGLWARVRTPRCQVAQVSGNVLEWPLLDRGWVFQERYLSPRIVYYARDQLFWECTSAFLSECGSQHRDFVHGKFTRHRFHQHHIRALQVLKLDINESNRGHHWRRVVEIYTALKLTNPNDLLPALAGVVEREMRRSERQDDVYIAGMWKSSILEDIAWYGKQQDGPCTTKDAPTWSWTSKKGHIKFETEGPKLLPILKLVNLSYEHAGRPSLGQVSNAILRLKGPTFSATIQHPYSQSGAGTFTSTIVAHHETEFPGFLELNTYHYVNLSGLKPGTPLLILVLSQFGKLGKYDDGEGSEGSVGMVLHQASDEHLKRLGLVVINDSGYRLYLPKHGYTPGQQRKNREAMVNSFVNSLPLQEVDII
jgi:hypothetical protein